MRQLVIGIGNPLRGDDGVGWRLLEELAAAAQGTPAADATNRGCATELRSLHQLTPELAPELAACQRALFIDAWLAPPTAGGTENPTTSPVLPCLCALDIDSAGEAGCSHQLEPAQLLAMAATLFGASPRSDALLVPAYEFGHGTAFSARLRRQLPTARRLLRRWLEAGHA